MSSSYETIIIGGGPAGLSAGLVLGRCRRRTLLIDSGRYRNERSNALHCLMGFDGIAPADLLKRSRKQLEAYENVTLRRDKVIEVSGEAEGFVVRCEGGAVYEARRILFATGVVDEMPPLAGIDDLFGRSVHVCPYCDGWEHRDAPIAVFGKGAKGAGLALMLRQWTDDLVLCTHGPPGLSREEAALLEKRGIRVQPAPISRLEGDNGCLRAIHFENGDCLVRQALFFNTDQHPRSTLLESLGCAFDEKGVTFDNDGRTSVRGVYVAGDASRDVQLVVIATAEGARTALVINRELLVADGHLPGT